MAKRYEHVNEADDAVHWKTKIGGTILEGDKSLNEEHRMDCEYRTKQYLERLDDDARAPDHYNPDRPVNFRRGTCPWCGNGQAQIRILQDDPIIRWAKAGRVHRGIEGGEWVGDATARVCLVCGRVELVDSQPKRGDVPRPEHNPPAT